MTLEIGRYKLKTVGYGKGQLISKCLFGVFTFFLITNQNKLTSSKVEFVCLFFGRNVGLKKLFRICLTFSERARGKRNHKFRAIEEQREYFIPYVICLAVAIIVAGALLLWRLR